jgi:hypothetical protein
MEDRRVENKHSRAVSYQQESRQHFVMKLTYYYDLLYKTLEFEDFFETV